MKTSRSKNLQQKTLAGYEQAVCECGCHSSFLRRKQGRPQLYVNPTHKKRAARARIAAKNADYIALNKPAGWRYWDNVDEDERNAIWQSLIGDDREIIQAMCASEQTPEAFLVAVGELFGIPLKTIKRSIQRWKGQDDE